MKNVMNEKIKRTSLHRLIRTTQCRDTKESTGTKQTKALTERHGHTDGLILLPFPVITIRDNCCCCCVVDVLLPR